MTKIWAWLKKFGGWITGVLALLVGAGWLWKRQKERLGKLRDELAVSEATKEIEILRNLREKIAESATDLDVDIAQVDQQLAQQKRKIVEAFEKGTGLSDEEVERAFADLGY